MKGTVRSAFIGGRTRLLQNFARSLLSFAPAAVAVKIRLKGL
jgi:hypothetical protein